MTELGMGADLLRLVGTIFWILVAAALLLAVLVPQGRKKKALAIAGVLGLFAAFPGRWAWHDYQAERAYRARLSEANARFAERCKTAGEKIYKTVEGVEGVMLLKLRPTDYSPYKQDAVDPYGEDFDWKNTDVYVGTFLWGRDAKGILVEKTPAEKPGYRYAEAIDPKDGKRYRYTASMKVVGQKDANAPNIKSELQRNPNFDLNNYAFTLDKTLATGPQPRYGVTYDDITTPEERALWIAGSSLKVIDTETNEVVAERIGYMIDRGLGNKGGGRQPWTYAQTTRDWSCPHTRGAGQTREFTEKVLKIKEQ